MSAFRLLLLHVPSSLLLAPLIFGLAWLWPGLADSWFSTVEGWLQRLARRRILTAILLGLLPIVLRLAVLPNEGVPVPHIHDEFGHLLVADTLLHWRLANPPHSNPEFFETIYVLQRPTYSSIYPIGIGISLAIGRLLFGHAWGGVLLFVSLMCAGVYWMLLNWVTPGWALLGGLLTVMNWGVISPWANTYFCGGAAAVAGCLIFGSLPRLLNNSRSIYGLALGLGLSYAWLIRPYEIILAVPCLAAFAFIYRSNINLVRLRPMLLLIGVGVAPAVLITVIHNHAVTGKYSEIPYLLSRREYGVPQTFNFQPAAIPSRILTPEQQIMYGSQKTSHDSIATFPGWALSLPTRFAVAGAYLGITLTPLLLVLPFCRFDRQLVWIIGSICLTILGSSLYGFFYEHYVAPMIGLFLLLGIAAMKRWNESASGKTAVRLFLTLGVCHFGAHYLLFANGNTMPGSTAKPLNPSSNVSVISSDSRSRILHQLLDAAGEHVVFVKYVGHHSIHVEWVHNGADIDDSRVIWARDRGSEEDMRLMSYYRGRTAWRVEVAPGRSELTRLP